MECDHAVHSSGTIDDVDIDGERRQEAPEGPSAARFGATDDAEKRRNVAPLGSAYPESPRGS